MSCHLDATGCYRAHERGCGLRTEGIRFSPAVYQQVEAGDRSGLCRVMNRLPSIVIRKVGLGTRIEHETQRREIAAVGCPDGSIGVPPCSAFHREAGFDLKVFLDQLRLTVIAC